MKTKFPAILAAVFSLALLLPFTSNAQDVAAPSFPKKVVRLVLPYPQRMQLPAISPTNFRHSGISQLSWTINQGQAA